jgi:hypothetical protein
LEHEKLNRRKIGFVTALILVIAVFGAAGWLWFNEASINYGFNLDYIYQRQGINWFTVDLSNNNRMNDTFVNFGMANVGYLAGTFSITVTFTNATFSTKTEQPYQEVGNNVVKFTYTLHHYEESQANVYFIIEENVTSFTISLNMEHGQPFMRSTENNPFGMSTLSYFWDSVDNTYRAAVPS